MSLIRVGIGLSLVLFSSFAFADSAAQSGKSIYGSKCASCHATNGSGKTDAGRKLTVPDLHGKQFVEMSDKQMFETIGRGAQHRKYPHSYLYTGLSEQDINNVVAYIRQLQKQPAK